MSEPLHSGNDGIPQHAAPEPETPATQTDELSRDGRLVIEVPNDLSDTALSGEVLAPRPEPVLSAARVAGVVSAVILAIGGLLKLVGVTLPEDYDLDAIADQAGNVVLALAGAWSLVGPWLMARLRARDKVTPLSDPRDTLGRKLTPIEEP